MGQWIAQFCACFHLAAEVEARVYLNGEKIWDVPKVFDSLTKYNAVTFAMQGSYQMDDYYVLSNIRLAVGAPDTRNKLLSQGKFVTRGIQFNTNTDSLQPESYGPLKDISNVLKENPGMKLRRSLAIPTRMAMINSTLISSRRRAAAVKNVLVKDFGIPKAALKWIAKVKACR